jgi:putative ABC transport system substrate-binding protein
MPVIGFLRNSTATGSEDIVSAFRRGLSEAGFVEGKNLAIEYRFADNQHDRLLTLTDDLIRRQVAAIVADMVAARAAKSLTSTTPIVFVLAVILCRPGLSPALTSPVVTSQA